MALNIKEITSLAERLEGEGHTTEANELLNVLKALDETAQEDGLPQKFSATLDMKPRGQGVKKQKPSAPVSKEPKPETVATDVEKKVLQELKYNKTPDVTDQREPKSPGQLREELQELSNKLKPEGYDEYMAQEGLTSGLDSLNWNETRSPDKNVLKVIEDMRKAGWQVFTPGELEQWMAHKDYVKAPELPGVRIGDEPGLENFEIPEASADDSPYLPEHQPGALNLSESERLSYVDKIAQEVKKTVPGLTSEQMGGMVSAVQRALTDQQTVSTIQDAEREKGVVWAAKTQVLDKLATIADRLDNLGATKEATLIDGFIQKHADDVLDYQEEDDDTEQSKRYDSKHHHSLQIREPKTKQERVDREGRDKHHVDTYQNQETGHLGLDKEASLSTRYCPDHIGVMTGRVGESTYQCPIDGAVFNNEIGWTDRDGKEHPGGSVASQTPDSSEYAIPHRIFDSRESTINRVN